jgi:hypothetical protein
MQTGEYVSGEHLKYFRYCVKPPCGFPDHGVVYIVRGYAIYNSMIAYILRVYATGMREYVSPPIGGRFEISPP